MKTPSLASRLALLSLLACLGTGQSFATSQTWTGATSSDWATNSNWSGNTTPPTAAETATFNLAGVNGTSAPTAIVVNTGRNIKFITFDTGAGSYFIGDTAGNALSLTAAGTANMTAGVTASQTINAPLITTGNNGSYNFSNNSTGAAIMTLAGGITAGGSSANTVTFLGSNTGANVFSGVFANGTATGALVKDDVGKWVLTNNNTYTGTTKLSLGTLQLDFATAPAASNIIAATSALTMGSKVGSNTLLISGKANTANTQTFASATGWGLGASHIVGTTSGTGTLTVNLGALPTGRVNGATMDFTIGSGVTMTTTTTNFNATANTLNLVATVNGNTFASAVGGNIVGLDDSLYTVNTATTLGAGGQVADMRGGVDTTLAGNVTTVGLRFNAAAARTITIAPGKMLTLGGGSAAGGLLVTSAVGANQTTITGGLLGGVSSRDLVIYQNNTAGDLRIDSILTSTNANGLSLTKSGPGAVLLTGVNTYNGSTTVNEGTVTFSGDYVAPNTQTLTVTNSTTITGVDTTSLFVGERVTDGTSNIANTFITGISGTTITVATAPVAGSTAPVTFSGGGGLGYGIGATAVQVGPAATLRIGNGGATGSMAPTQGITSTGTVAFNRSDAGLNFSSPIVGTGTVAQIGTGTTTLTGTQAYTGPTRVDAGTLLVNTSIATSSMTTVNSGGTLGGTGSTGALTLNLGGVVAPGVGGIGTLSTTNLSLIWNGQTAGTFGQMQFDLSGAGNTSDLIAIGTGFFDKGTGSIFDFNFNGSGLAGTTYTLATFGSTDFLSSDFGYTNLGAGLGGTFALSGSALTFNVTAVPEPSTWAMLAAGAVISAVCVRRRRVA